MRGMDYSAVVRRTPDGGYEFTDEALSALRIAGLTDFAGGVEFVPWPLMAELDAPNGSVWLYGTAWLVSEEDEPQLDVALAALKPLGAREVEVAVVRAWDAYDILSEALAIRNHYADPECRLRWMGVPDTERIYIVIEG